jgi:hypothetical protein
MIIGGRDALQKEAALTTPSKSAMHALRIGALAVLLGVPHAASAQESDQTLAEGLANPISSLISVPFQYNYDCCYGPLDGERHTLNIQPVIPTGISPNWNLIVRTIVPVVGFTAPARGFDDEFGPSNASNTRLLRRSNREV